MAEEFVILVNEKDEPQGVMEKMKAHKEAELHRALSVFIFNKSGEMLLQQRASHKYHSAGLWSNACCSHPRPKEDTLKAAQRRLEEEIGLKECAIDKAFSFVYKATFENGLTEHEFDHVFVGVTDVKPVANPDEVSALRYITMENLEKDMNENGSSYTYWFRKAMPALRNYLISQ